MQLNDSESCASTFQAHKSIRPNARGLLGLVESRIGNRDRHDRRLRDDACIKHRKKIVYHIRAICTCLTASSRRIKKEPYYR